MNIEQTKKDISLLFYLAKYLINSTPVPGYDPTFYFTNSYEEDLELWNELLAIQKRWHIK